MSDRMTKQQLKEDALMKTTGEAVDFASHHARLLVGLVVGLVAVAAVVFFVRTGGQKAQSRSAGMLTEAWADYNNGSLEPAAARLDDILKDSGGTRAGKQALLLYGDIRYAQGRFTDAAGYYRRAQSAFKGDPILGMAARRGLAASLENDKKYADAARTYQSLADTAPNQVTRADLLLDVARNQLRAGDIEAATKIYQEISDNPENPQAAQEAKLRLAETRYARGTAPGGNG